MKKLIFIIPLFILVLGLAFWVVNSRSTKTTELTLLPSPTPVANIPSGWQTYKSEKFKYSISYPGTYALEPNGEYSITLVKPSDQPSVGPANFIYVSVVPEGQIGNEGEIYNYNPGHFSKLNGLEIGEKISLADTDQPELNEWFTYTRVDSKDVSGYPAKVFENTKPWEFPPGTTDVRYHIEANGKIYILGYYYGGEGVASAIDPREAYQTLNTFRKF